MNTKQVLISSLLIFCLSCGSKTATEYGKAYCECMKANDDDLTKCKGILEDAKSELGEDNENARKEFKKAYIECMGE